ncbi:MAG: tetratricopeptide repeat protein, partial [Phycisphaeraceae bacterium]
AVPEGETPPEPPIGVARVLNITGKDRVNALYKDDRRPDNTPRDLLAQGRLVSNGALAITDNNYDKSVEYLHVGEKLFVRVIDADMDISDDRDRTKVRITSERGEDETVELEETLAHSGVFTGSILLKAIEKPTVNNLPRQAPEIETFFGDQLKVTYTDPAASTESGTLELSLEIPIVIGTDGLVKAFSKVFGDETLAVDTRFTIAESYFELFKSHKKLARDDEMKTDLEAGKRVLREVMEDYPDPKYVPRIQYLLGQFAQELGHWDEAIASYSTIVRQFPEHTLAPDAQYKLAQSYEESGNFDEALEAYVTLAATYPKSPLIANVMIRINEYFWNKENFIVAAEVGKKFLERFDGHQHASKMAFRVGQCYYKAEKYMDAANAFDDFVKVFPDDELTSLGLFWSGEAFRMAKNVPLAFRRYNRCRWDFPESEAAKYARGRLALPEMLAQFEREADLENDK